MPRCERSCGVVVSARGVSEEAGSLGGVGLSCAGWAAGARTWSTSRLARLDDAALEPLLVHGQRAEPHVDLGRLARRALEGLMRGGRLTEQALALGRRIGQRLSNRGDGLLRARPELRGLALGAIALAL